jgi:DNA-binding IclR family transcriptional regulator
MLGLLDLFTVHAPVWRSDSISRRLGYTRPTVYRYLKYLCDAGLLMGIGGSAFCLGPRIVQLEQQIQLTDPVLAAGRLILPKTLVSSSWHLLLLCSFCQNSVLCIHQEVRQSKLGRMLQTKIKRPRGVPLPLFRGSASLAILAFLNPHRCRALYERHQEEIGEAGLGRDWGEFRKCINSIQERGYVTSVNSSGSGLAGLSAPLFDADGRVIGSVTGVMTGLAADRKKVAALAASIVACANRISRLTHSAVPRGIDNLMGEHAISLGRPSP